jgi:hypothetical protein
MNTPLTASNPGMFDINHIFSILFSWRDLLQVFCLHSTCHSYGRRPVYQSHLVHQPLHLFIYRLHE